MLGKLSSRRFTIVLKRRQEVSQLSQLSRIQRSQQMELKLKQIQSQTLKRKNLIRNQTFLKQGSQMLSLRHGRKILTMQVEMELKKTRGISQKN
ncbi:hypothetical protein Gotur_010962, partial [Gossypium turneri]